MSESSRRGLGRAGRGRGRSKKPHISEGIGTSSMTSSEVTGRAGARATPMTSRSIPSSMDENENILLLHDPNENHDLLEKNVGEQKAGFPQSVYSEEPAKKAPAFKADCGEDVTTAVGASEVARTSREATVTAEVVRTTRVATVSAEVAGTSRETAGAVEAAGTSGEAAGAAGGVTPIGRGGIRGRRKISVVDIVKTKPETCVTKQGDAGTKVSLMSNYFTLETMADWALYQYRVDFNVPEERESVLREWLRRHHDKLRAAYIFDGSMLFSSQRLTVGKEPLLLTHFRENDNFVIEIQIRLIQQLNFGSSVYLQIFNILIRRCLLHLDLKLVNRNYFDPKASIRLPQHNLEIWPGYVTSIRQHERNVLMCAEITHKVMRTDTALRLLSECIREGRDYRRLFQQSMIGAIVLTDYNNKTYRIDDVDFNSTPLSEFKLKDGETITYVQYYLQRYQIKIVDLKQPLLVSRAKAREIRGGKERQCLLIPELCRMTGLTNRMLENRNLMKDLSDITRVSPEVRIQRLQAFNLRLQSEKRIAEDFENWGLRLSRNMASIMGRELPSERIVGGKSIVYSTGPEVDWTRNLRTAPMLHYGRFECFVVIVPGRLKRELEGFLTLLKKSADGMQFRIPRPYILETPTDNPVDLIEATERAVSEFSPDIILYAFTTDRSDRYCAVKKKCYVDRGIASQVVLSKSMKAKGAMSIATKIAVQLNCKVGGAPWTVDIPAENVMVIGFDVCHSKGDKKSIGAMVASLNKSMTAWYSSVSYHERGEELSNDLPLAMWKALLKYREVNHVLPNRIFFYRDGVGEGQLSLVFNHEVAMIKKKLTELYGGETWKLAFIVVTKRIHTRFFSSSGNPRPGTVVDDVVTLPEKYDFFLVSQSVRQGTVSPTSYNVISDNLGWGANHIQRFTYKMTHLYYNCSVTVRVPAPCQYAHKLAFVVSQNLGVEPHPNLATRLYFL